MAMIYRSFPLQIATAFLSLLWLICSHSHASSPDAYERLHQALQNYRHIASDGGWPIVPSGRSLRKGDQGERVLLLKKRLIITGDLSSGTSSPDNAFDDALSSAVMSFQKRHGLKEDGIVGTKTLQSINVPVTEKIRQIEINLTRLKMMPEGADHSHILVNIAAFELSVTENEETVMTMKVITGKQYWHTPEFSADMTYLVFNPSWYVPRSIAVSEILPKLKADPGYLLAEGFKVYPVSERNGKEIDPATVDWSGVTEDNLIYRFVQQPGPKNPLGKIKFMLPNEHNVYLHDTPAKVLFKKSSRAFSHGCIRTERPADLAEYVLHGDPSWTRERILSTIDSGEETTVTLPAPLHVHIHYLTAWVDESNIVHFRNDIYGRDI